MKIKATIEDAGRPPKIHVFDKAYHSDWLQQVADRLSDPGGATKIIMHGHGSKITYEPYEENDPTADAIEGLQQIVSSLETH